MSGIKNDMILTGVIVDQTMTLTLTELKQKLAIDDVLFDEMQAFGLIELMTTESGEAYIHFADFRRIQIALRLLEDLELNLSGAVLALELLEELERARHELAVLHQNLEY